MNYEGRAIHGYKKTKEYYANYRREGTCSCVYCQNYIDEVKAAYPVVAEYLATLGVNIERPFEAMLPYEVEDEKWEYAGVQYLIVGNADGFEETKIGDVEIFVTTSHPSATYEGEYFVIEISPIRVKCRRDKYQFEEFEDSKGDRSCLTTHISLTERCLKILKNFTVK